MNIQLKGPKLNASIHAVEGWFMNGLYVFQMFHAATGDFFL